MIFLAVVGIVLLGIYLFYRQEVQNNWSSRKSWTHKEFQIAGTWFLIFAAILLLVTFANSVFFYTTGLNVEAKATSLQQSLYQRDQLVDMIRTELSNEQFEELMRATTAAEVRLIFSGDSVSDILITRSTQIVDMNSKYFAKYNEIINEQIELCNGIRNFFAPRFPGVGDCSIDLVDGLPDRLESYSGK